MIIGIGSDIVDIRRIENILRRHGKRFEERCFTKAERNLAEKRQGNDAHHNYNTYAKRFAAKEACVKALGTGFIDNITMKDISVKKDRLGRPYLLLNGGALQKLNSLIPENMHPHIHLSLSDEPPYAQAFVVIEAY